MNDTTKQKQAEIERKIANIKRKLDKLEREEEKRVEAYEAKREPLQDEIETLEGEKFRLIYGYGIGDKLLITQEFCDLRVRSWSPLQRQEALGTEAIILRICADGINFNRQGFVSGTQRNEFDVVHRMREAWLAKNGGQS